MEILVTAKSIGSARALVSPIKELQRRGHHLTVYATGSETEARGFQDVGYLKIEPSKDYFSLQKYDVVITGIHEGGGADRLFIQGAHREGIPSISVLEHHYNYPLFWESINQLPTIITVMNDDCIEMMKKELGELDIEAAKRSRVVGWTAFDNYAQLREEFNNQRRTGLLSSVGLNPDEEIYFHATQNLHPDTEYVQKVARKREDNEHNFQYEMSLSQAVFEAASDLGRCLVVKPHPGELFNVNFTKELAERHGFRYLPAEACDTKQLMLASYSVTAGRSTCLIEGTLLDRNVGGIIPDMGEEWISPFPPLALGAIPYTQEGDGIKKVLEQVTSHDETIVQKLAADRQKFSVDGKASQRLADLVEEIG